MCRFLVESVHSCHGSCTRSCAGPTYVASSDGTMNLNVDSYSQCNASADQIGRDESKSLTPTAAPRDTFASLSAPQRRELRSILRDCNKRNSGQLEFLIKHLPIDGVRESILSALWEREFLISRPANRGRLLEALFPYAHEPKVQAFAMLSLKEPDYARSLHVCAPAARILAATIKSPDDAIIDELLALGRRYGESKNDPAAKIAFMLLSESPATSYLHQKAHYEARSWYAKRYTKDNPWLDLLTSHRSRLGFSLLSDIVRGSVRDPHDTSVLLGIVTLPFLPHEIAVIGSLVGVAAREVCKLLGQNNRMANSTAFGIAAAIIIGSRVMWHASRADKFNGGRNRERVEALHHLKSFTQLREDSPSAEEHSLARRALALLGEARTGFFQSAPVKAAAQAAWDGVDSLSELKAIARSVSSGSSPNADVSMQPA